ncbi:MAG: FHA domain-containing protein [Candidatus Methanofastidiosia archaeon]|jgi:tetratricopeptide (TPR) repeat protein
MKKAALLVTIAILFSQCSPIFSEHVDTLIEQVEIKDFDDQYTQGVSLPVYIKKDATYEIEERQIHIRIIPQKYRAYQKGGKIYGEKDYFLKVLVFVSLENSENSKEFESYLNFEHCEDSGRLFWDHAGEDHVDRGGRTFDQDTPVTVSDTYITVTIELIGAAGSLYPCIPGYDLYCESDSDCLYYMDSLTFLITVEYTSAQKKLQEDLEEAVQYVQAASGLVEAGKFEKAKEEYQKAKDIYDEVGDTEKSESTEEDIDYCDSYISGQENLDEGIRLFREAADMENYTEAISTYEKARAYFELAQSEFDDADDTKLYDECQNWIDQCDDEIENLENVGTLRMRLVVIIVALAVAGGAAGGYSWLKKQSPSEKKDTIVLMVKNSQTGESVQVHVNANDKIGKVRQRVGTTMGIVPHKLIYNGRVCPPDQTVEECGLPDGGLVEIVPSRRVKKKVKPEAKPEEKLKPEKNPEKKYEEKPEEKPKEPETKVPSLKKPRLMFENQAFYLTKDVMTIGRGKDADITIPDPKRFISRIHAKIYKDKNTYYIEDNNSNNGTFIYKKGQYKEIKKTNLSHGDVIVLSYKPSRGVHITLQFKVKE